jgi:hypothetical protein
MTKEFKITVLYSTIYILLYILVSGILYFSFKEIKIVMIIPISAVIAYILLPRIKELETQSGMKTQIKWNFIKKIFII